MSKGSTRGKDWLNNVRPQVLAIYDYTCSNCGYDGHDTPSQMHVDHIIPKDAGGSDDLENLTLLCGTIGNKCNLRKGSKLYKDKTWFDPEWFTDGPILRPGA